MHDRGFKARSEEPLGGGPSSSSEHAGKSVSKQVETSVSSDSCQSYRIPIHQFRVVFQKDRVFH